MARDELMPAITLFEQRVDEAERNANELLKALNMLRAEAGLPPRPSGGGGGNGLERQGPTQIKSDTFYGKRQQTAIREYLEMRKVQGLGPAKPREIYDALVSGGYAFEAKSADVALVGLRALLRKRSHIFHKLPSGTYGMASWYPHAKAKASAGAEVDDDADDQDESKAASDTKSDAA